MEHPLIAGFGSLNPEDYPEGMTFRSLIERQLEDLDEDAGYTETIEFLKELMSEAANLKMVRHWRREKEGGEVPGIPHATAVRLTEEPRKRYGDCLDAPSRS